MTVHLRLTYAELGERLGVPAEAARQRARRRHWPISKGNDGKARVSVTAEEIGAEPQPVTVRPDGVQPDDRQDNRPDDRTELIAELRARIAGLEGERDRLATEARLSAERAARAEGEAAAVRTAIADLAGRLDRAGEELADLRRPWWQRLLRPR